MRIKIDTSKYGLLTRIYYRFDIQVAGLCELLENAGADVSSDAGPLLIPPDKSGNFSTKNISTRLIRM